jgi:transcriptional regulator with XRE-family HTH domain
MAEAAPTSIDYVAIGQRLRAFRIGASLLAEEIAERMGVSRAVVYRLEKGEIVKIETLERLAELLGTSLASLLGVEHEYYTSALGLFERYRQLEETSERIIAHFEPLSLLLTTPDYLRHLRSMLAEMVPAKDDEGRMRDIEHFLEIAAERKATFEKRRPHLICLVGIGELERFVHVGMAGRLKLPRNVRERRIAAARAEVEHIAELMEADDFHVQIGVIDDAMPASTFQVFSSAERKVLAVSPFRLGELPNMHNGIAMVTSSPEAVRLYEAMIGRLWRHAEKGAAGAQMIRAMLARAAAEAR